METTPPHDNQPLESSAPRDDDFTKDVLGKAPTQEPHYDDMSEHHDDHAVEKSADDRKHDDIGGYQGHSQGHHMAPDALTDRLTRAIQKRNPAQLRRLLNRTHFADVAEVMAHHLSKEQAVTCFQYLNMGQAAQVLLSLDDDLQAHCLNTLPTLIGGKILRAMASDDAVDVLQELEAADSQRLLEGMPLDEDTQAIQELLLEEPDTAAGLMTTDYIDITIDETAGEAMAKIRQAEDKDFIYYVYVVDENEQLLGVLSLKQLVRCPEDMPVHQAMNSNVKSVLIHFDDAFVANLFRKYDNLLAMPVVDAQNTLRGIITVDDVIEVIEEENSEELYRASGINVEAVDEKNLLTGPFWNAFKARFPWLGITVFAQLMASFIIASYETTVQTMVIAVSFMPLLTGLAGNMGTQTDTISVRGLALGLITPRNVWEKIRREWMVALSLGMSFSLIIGFFSFVIYRDLQLTLLLSTWVIGSLLLAGTVGMAVPYLYSQLFKRDPAGVGGPLITTTTDLLTFSIYLYILTTVFLPAVAAR